MAIEQNRGEAANDLEGLDGWLILVGIVLFVNPVTFVILIGAAYLGLHAQGQSWSFLTETDWWGMQALLDLSVYSVILLADFYLIVLFFRKKRSFPKVFIWVYLLTALFYIAVALWAVLTSPEVSLLDSEVLTELGESLITLVILVPYMFLSKRVKATFVR